MTAQYRTVPDIATRDALRYMELGTDLYRLAGIDPTYPSLVGSSGEMRLSGGR